MIFQRYYNLCNHNSCMPIRKACLLERQTLIFCLPKLIVFCKIQSSCLIIIRCFFHISQSELKMSIKVFLKKNIPLDNPRLTKQLKSLDPIHRRILWTRTTTDYTRLCMQINNTVGFPFHTHIKVMAAV